MIIDPSDAPGHCDHLRRSEDEIAKWWGRPYIVSSSSFYEVRCLDGKRSDRPSTWGISSTLEGAFDIVDTSPPSQPDRSFDDVDLDF